MQQRKCAAAAAAATSGERALPQPFRRSSFAAGARPAAHIWSWRRNAARAFEQRLRLCDTFLRPVRSKFVI